MEIIRGAAKIRGIISELTETKVSGVVWSLPTSATRDYLRLQGVQSLPVRVFIVDQVDKSFIASEYEGERWTVGFGDRDGVFGKSWSTVEHNSVSGVAFMIQQLLQLEQEPRFVKSIQELTVTARAKKRSSGRDKNISAEQNARAHILRKVYDSEVGRLIYHTRRVAKLTECVLEICRNNCFIQVFQNPSTRRIAERGNRIPILPF
jgi:hypothetical protein